jgi:two-component system chemotaxis sensor kinase CheA
MGEIITYLPTGSGADADSIELDILIASRAGADDLVRALAGKGVSVEEIPRHVGAAPPAPVTPLPRPIPIASIAPPMEAPADSESVPDLDDRARPRQRNVQIGAVRGPVAAQSLRSVAQTVRVDIHKLNRLMNIVGELSIVRTSSRAWWSGSARTSRIATTDLHRLQRTFDRHLATMQQGILEVRMVPLGQVFDKLARVVRQISREADKSVNLVITGAETEVDKLIVEELRIRSCT